MYDEKLELKSPIEFSSDAERHAAIKFFNAAFRAEESGLRQAHELSDENHRQLYVPVGFGHAFLVLSDVADVVYRLSSYYKPETEAGIAWDDTDVGIEWPATGYVISDRDRNAPSLAEVRDSLPW